MNGLPIARIAGIEIRVHVSWVIIVGLVTALATTQIEIVAPGVGDPLRFVLAVIVGFGFFVSALVHDLGHAWIARREGVEVPAVLVSFFGGTTPLDPEAGSGRSETAIALAGPLTSLVLGGAMTLIATGLGAVGGPVAGPLGAVSLVLGALNILLGLANLIPAYPLDGGRAVRGAAWWRTGNERRASMIAALAGRAVGWAIVGGGLMLALSGQMANGILVAVSGWFLAMTARGLREQTEIQALLQGLRIDEFVERDVTRIAPGLTVDTFAQGLLDDESPAAAAVVGPDGLLGVIGVGHVRRLRHGRWTTTRAEDLMAAVGRVPPLVAGGALWPAIVRLRRSGIDGLPVVDGSSLIGVFTRRSIGLAMRSRQGDPTPGVRS
ncbi:MAG: site-2 protease family protein [Chloroflexota bacterium]|mgnify:CR=1 FL=1